MTIQQSTNIKITGSINSIPTYPKLSRKSCKEYYLAMINLDSGLVKFCPITCGQTYGRCCYDQRYNRSMARLKSYKIKTNRLIHVSIGIPEHTSTPSKELKREYEKILVKFHRLARRFYKWRALRIFDMEQKGSYHHFHYAVIPERKSFDLRILRKILRYASSGRLTTLSVHGFRSKRILFKYFAKRMSGKYGHKPKEFFLEDIISYEVYHDLFFNVRSLVVICPNGMRLTCNIAPDVFTIEHNLHGSWSWMGIQFRPFPGKPPPQHELTLDNAITYLKTQDLSRISNDGMVYLGYN